MAYHNSVLLRESVEGLAIRPGGTYVDATYGGGGHTRAILSTEKEIRVFGFDQDEQALANVTDDPRLTTVHSNFRFIRNFLKLYRAVPVDGILADLGVSSHQIDEPSRGFSTRFEGILDMRMNRSKGITAREVVNKYDEASLALIFSRYGEIRDSARLASRLVELRRNSPIETTGQLASIAATCAGRGKEFKYQAQVFQALRIEVNQELEALEEFLRQATEILRPGGRLVIIAYHSLEDRLVKNWFRAGNFEGEIKKDFFGHPQTPLNLVTRKAIVPTEEETGSNPRARSAKLRIAEKI